MDKIQFRVLYREFLFRITDIDLLSKHAQGDSRTLLGQLASLLIFCSMLLAIAAAAWGSGTHNAGIPQLIGAWNMEHFLIATTMLVVGVFAVLSWESIFPNRRDVLVLAPLPISGRTLFLAKVAAVATALGLTVAALHCFAGLAWPFALASSGWGPMPALVFEAATPPVTAENLPSVMNRDIAPMLSRLDLAAADGRAGIVLGVSEHRVRRVMTYGAAKSDSMFEIGSISKTFTGLLLAQMAVNGTLDLREPVRDLLPPGSAPQHAGYEITLLDLATHHSGLPAMPDNAGPPNDPASYTGFRRADLYDYIQPHGLEKSGRTHYEYSNLGFAVLGAALSNRAHMTYADLLRTRITQPLGLKDTVIDLSPEQLRRLMEGHDGDRKPTPRWDLDAFASAGGIRSTVSDMLTYLEAQLHPEYSPFPAALKQSQILRGDVAGRVNIALAWDYDGRAHVFEDYGGTAGFTSFAFFDPQRDFVAFGAINAGPGTFPFIPLLAQHIRQRLAGEPPIALAPVQVVPAGPIRSFIAYWIAMFAAALFTFCLILAIQGLASQLSPRRWFLRLSPWLQSSILCALIFGYFLQRSPATVLAAGPEKSWLSWIPSYWFVGLYQQISGDLHPALLPYAHRAWLALGCIVLLNAALYTALYLRTLQKIADEPDITPVMRSNRVPRLGTGPQTAIVQFSIRSLFRSRQHRMVLSFYLGLGFAFAVLFLNAPPELSGVADSSAWAPRSIPLLASTILLTGFWVIGTRVAFSLPLQLDANWLFRCMPLSAGSQCLRARRCALLIIAVVPACLLSATVLFAVWPWKLAAAHAMILVLLAIILAELPFQGIQRIPFACSYLPGRSNIHVMFWLYLYIVVFVTLGAATKERQALSSPLWTTVLVLVMASAALACLFCNERLARDKHAELRFEEIPADQLLTLELQ